MVTHSYPLHHKSKALTESEAACRGLPTQSARTRAAGMAQPTAGPGPASWDKFHISALATAGSSDISEPYLETAHDLQVLWKL